MAITKEPLITRRRLSPRRLAAPLTAAVLLLALLVGGGIVAFVVSQSAVSDAPPEAGPFVTPPPANPAATFDVREANGATLTLLPANIEGDAFTATLSPGVTLEAFVPGLPSRIEPGAWLTFIGEQDPVRNYVIRQVIAIRDAGAPGPDGLARSPAGFTGVEMLSNPNHRPVLWGRVESITVYPSDGGADVVLAGPDGPITVEILARVPLFFVEPYDAPITDGDHIAILAPAGASPTGAEAILVSPQGAR
ncbi:MAG: hypothetical protein OXI51_13560 [Chloroflexota bacterium]|nr:hypothetical protein [Chloroflexota bacterium]